ncbi:TorF family putative porin [Bordetella genomosp. 13]|uniref:TorF family putative porin n=1 Tax=Bordetella genomosp. 13 TaxID=463040 RepID=UPI0011A2CB78|nr:TorF family putative porin [Bordetella genomosp. 13]
MPHARLPRLSKPLAAGATLAAALCLADAAQAQQQQQQADAPASYTLGANLSLASQYRYRGLMQTNNKPAVSAGFDFVHASGFYLGNWNSSISWLDDSHPDVSAPIEVDFYGGYKGRLAEDAPFDVGVLQYYYPGDYPSGYTSPDTTELYAGAGYGPVFLKYSYAVTNLFGFARSSGSQYVDLSGDFDTGVWGLAVNAHVGYQYVRGLDDGSYWDWKLGLTKDLGQGFSLSAAYVDTNADRRVYTNTKGRDMGRAAGLVTLTRTF